MMAVAIMLANRQRNGCSGRTGTSQGNMGMAQDSYASKAEALLVAMHACSVSKAGAEQMQQTSEPRLTTNS